MLISYCLPRHKVSQLQSGDLAAESVLQFISQTFDDGEAAVRAPEERLADGVDAREHVDGLHGSGHGVLGREQVQVQDGAVVFDDRRFVSYFKNIT